MPYFFFKEHPNRSQHSRWEPIDHADTFEAAKEKQKALRTQEKQNHHVYKIVQADDLESAIQACQKMMGFQAAKKWAASLTEYEPKIV